jgi:gas vesicle protein
MSFIRCSKYKDSLSYIDQLLDKINDSLYLIEVELEEIEENDSNEETQLLKNQIEERMEAIGNNKEEIYELFEIMIKKKQELQKEPEQQEQQEQQEQPKLIEKEININFLITSIIHRSLTKKEFNNLHSLFEKEETRQLLLSLLPDRREILEKILNNDKFLSQDKITTEEINDKIYLLTNNYHNLSSLSSSNLSFSQ